jgi:hypothetical protein
MVFSKDLSATRMGKELKIVPLPINDEQSLLKFQEWRIEVMMKERNAKRSYIISFLNKHNIQQYTNRQVVEGLQRRMNIMINAGIWKKRNSGYYRLKSLKTKKDFCLFDSLWMREWSTHWKWEGIEYAPQEERHVFMRSLEIWFKAVQDLLQNDFFLGVENVPKEKMFFLNLSFLPDSFFGTLDDPYMHAAANFCSENKYDAFMSKFLKTTFKTKVHLEEHGGVMAFGAMRIFSFKHYTKELKWSETTNQNIAWFWNLIEFCISGTIRRQSHEVMPHMCTMMYTVNEIPQQPHYDYSTADLRENNANVTDNNMPWNVDMSLGNGGFHLNVWHNETFDYPLPRSENTDFTIPESNHAILLTVPMKYPFLMRGDTVHAGGLNNRIQIRGNECVGNGALRLHFYLSQSASRFDGSVASTKSTDNHIYTHVNRDRSKESLVNYLVQSDGSRW